MLSCSIVEVYAMCRGDDAENFVLSRENVVKVIKNMINKHTTRPPITKDAKKDDAPYSSREEARRVVEAASKQWE